MVKAWLEEEVLYVINEKKQVPYIWDVKSVSYKNKLKKVKFWEEVATKLNTNFCPNTPFDAGDVARKWNNLKSYYNSEYIKSVKAKKSGESAEVLENIMIWKYSEPMEFLLSTNEATSSVNNFNKKSLDELYTENSLDIELSTDEEFLNDTAIQSQKEYDESQNFLSSTPITSKKSAHTSRKKRKLDDENLTEICESSKKLTDVLAKKLSNNEPNAAFGAFVVNEINNLSKRKQLVAKSKISTILLIFKKMRIKFSRKM